MFEKILVTTDASEYSRRALQTALKIAQQYQSKIELLFVAYTPEAYWGYNMAHLIQEITPDQIEERGKLTLNATIEGIDVKDVILEKKMLQGQHPASVILEEIAKENIDLVVMGSHGYGPIAGSVLGSVSQRVVHRSECPVLIVK
ncbi:universal stress protein [Desulfosporosinus sp.]|uniref:universal stress protein n=1 Tax=Desulfosporosinus sp. TaxID=157907 RepID=UPI0025C35E07|nr:universal stress protein [Desulfosporosinus sp.]MBC2721942.1 universal stress protein [Desulfosporosinus sp.]MBC2728453.1 universal stress protein [Desulfosporosinus sp.]